MSGQADAGRRRQIFLASRNGSGYHAPAEKLLACQGVSASLLRALFWAEELGLFYHCLRQRWDQAARPPGVEDRVG
jgi:hypothetical protein